MKSIVQVIATLLAAIAPLIVAYPLTATEWINVGVVGAGAVVVWIARNDPPGSVWSVTKAIMSGVAAIGVILISALVDQQISTAEMLQIAAAVSAAIAVYHVPNPT